MIQNNEKMIKYMYKKLKDKKENIKNEISNINLKIFAFSYLISNVLLFIFSFLIFESFGFSLFVSPLLSIIFFIPISFLPVWNILITKNLKKHNLYKSYGTLNSFEHFIYYFLKSVITSSEKNTLIKLSDEILYICSFCDTDNKQKIQFMLLDKIEGDEYIKKIIKDKKEQLLKDEKLEKSTIIIEENILIKQN